MYELTLMAILPVDYFRGSHNPVIQIPIDGTMTFNQLLNELRIPYYTDHIEELNESEYFEAVNDFEKDLLFHLSHHGNDLDDIVDESLPIYNDESTDDGDYYVFIELTTLETLDD